MYALILNEKVMQVSERVFPVSPSLKWVQCDNECEVGWLYIDSKFTKPNVIIEEEQDYQKLREESYRREADPLYFQEKRGEVPEGTWLLKVQEIKERYPKTETKEE